jgi:hypothetical protein
MARARRHATLCSVAPLFWMTLNSASLVCRLAIRCQTRVKSDVRLPWGGLSLVGICSSVLGGCP